MNGQNELPERLVFIPRALGCMEGGDGGLLSQAVAWSSAPAEQLQSCGLAPKAGAARGRYRRLPWSSVN